MQAKGIKAGLSRRELLLSATAAGGLLSRGLSAAIPSAVNPSVLKPEDRRFLEDLAKRCCSYFWEQAGIKSGIVLDRAGVNGSPSGNNVGSSAATGFGLTALCIAANRGWLPKEQARARVLTTLRYFWAHAFHDHGWYYHFMDVHTGARRLNSEISSIDTALFLCGVLTAQGYFTADREIQILARQIFDRVDFGWMLNGDPSLLSHGVMPGAGFLKARWGAYSEASVLYLMAIGSVHHPVPRDAWYAWVRPEVKYQQWSFISGGPLFTHQYSHAWVDFRHQMDDYPLNYFQNSQIATYAHRDFCVSLQPTYTDYNSDMWGITASDGRSGYVAWGGPPEAGPINGTLVPCAAAGSLMFAPEICLPVLRQMYSVYGSKLRPVRFTTRSTQIGRTKHYG